MKARVKNITLHYSTPDWSYNVYHDITHDFQGNLFMPSLELATYHILLHNFDTLAWDTKVGGPSDILA
jgi:hypothetical protein